MDNLKVEGTQSTPSILADVKTGVMEMRGDPDPVPGLSTALVYITHIIGTLHLDQ